MRADGKRFSIEELGLLPVASFLIPQSLEEQLSGLRDVVL